MKQQDILTKLGTKKPMDREGYCTKKQWGLFGVLKKQHQAKTGVRLGKPENRGEMSDAIDALFKLGYTVDSTKKANKSTDIKDLLKSLLSQ